MDTSANEDEPTETVESLTEGLMIMTFTEYLQATRTLTQTEVDRRTAEHDADDLRPVERATFDTGSIRKVEQR